MCLLYICIAILALAHLTEQQRSYLVIVVNIQSDVNLSDYIFTFVFVFVCMGLVRVGPI